MDRSWLAYAEAILVEDLEKEDRNLNHLREITNALLSGIVDGNENEAKELIDDDVNDVEVDANAILESFDIFYDNLWRNSHV